MVLTITGNKRIRVKISLHVKRAMVLLPIDW